VHSKQPNIPRLSDSRQPTGRRAYFSTLFAVGHDDCANGNALCCALVHGVG
jgi:hypothetical protein